MEYEFVAPRSIHFGWGRRTVLKQIAPALGRRCFVVLGSRTLKASPEWTEVENLLDDAGVGHHLLTTISHELLVADVDQGVAELRSHDPRPDDWLLAIGGGSAIDLAKAVGALVTQRSAAPTSDYLEGVGRGLTLVEAPMTLVAMPTTGGTGAEATKNAVISSMNPPYKKSLRSDRMVPPVVIVDPELGASVPASTTTWSGMDAITQLIESYLSRRARRLPRALSIDGLRVALPALPVVVRDGRCRWAREAMAHAALLSGMALANSGLGMAHGVAAALGVHANVAHGLACAVMLPVALRVNRQTCAREMATLARDLNLYDGKHDDAAADALVEHVTELSRELGVPERLSFLGVNREMLPSLVSSSRGNSMNGNPRELSDDELFGVLEAML